MTPISGFRWLFWIATSTIGREKRNKGEIFVGLAMTFMDVGDGNGTAGSLAM